VLLSIHLHAGREHPQCRHNLPNRQPTAHPNPVKRYDKRLVEAGIRDVLEDGSMYEAAAAVATAKAAGKGGKAAGAKAAEGSGGEDGGGGGASPEGQQQAAPRGRAKRVQEDKNQRKLSAFFTAA
jgi:hypothetical protein